jgi:mRNA-degrading endonuclease RelE of RelBE toxin-antitoxin system
MKLICDEMNTLFQASEKFEQDIQSFQAKERERIASKINQYCSDFENNPATFRQQSYRPFKVILPGDLSSSLYALRIDRYIRVILTLEDDPLFNQTIVTLLRVVRHDSLEQAFKGIAEALYQGHVSFGQGDQNG